MRGMHLRQDELAIGMRWVTASRIAHGLQRDSLEDPKIETVVDFDHDALRLGHNIRVTLECEGERRQVIMAHTGMVVEKGRRVFWNDPLPNDDVTALRLVEAAFMNPRGRSATLLWVSTVNDGIAYAHVVTDDRHHSEDMMTHHGQMRTSITARAMRFASDVAAGDLVAIIVGNSHIENGMMVHTPKAETTIAQGMTLSDAAAIPSYKPLRSDFASGNFEGSYALIDEDEWAIARSEPSEALALVYQDGDDTRTIVLAHTGAAFHRQEDIEPLIERQLHGVGLWAYTNAKIHAWVSHEGEHDMDMSGEVTPADENIISRMFGDHASVEAEIVGKIDEHLDVGELIEAARQAQRAEDEHQRMRREALETAPPA